ncbi:DUF1003 domain-containing protein [Rhizobium sp. RU36D]|uniref:DUF1003 domain-containing protein n=1 Tax=Rhizobium sp. RU36D TaxID=1907415 RepID=UPI0009D81335|nr:DUF1003 domain-containing protein [Rhizobium sp. RU36D]SMC80826.1 Uncharacterized membrane protein [Rhizobium sp. RU36D]
MPISPDQLHKHLDTDGKELGETERMVLRRAVERRTVATDINAQIRAEAGFGDRLADAIARIGGSWSFIISFGLFLVVWAVTNTYLLAADAFDPYPFVFLNLILSMLAAIQAPIIMMSQNRQAERDRLEAQKDYEVNLKAELEVLSLHQKIDMQVLKELAEIKLQLDQLAKRHE